MLLADEDQTNLDLSVSKIETQVLDNGNDRTGPAYCNSGVSGVDRVYLEAIVEHKVYTTYVYQPGQCQYDAAYYSCWYGSAAGLPYHLRVQACCPGGQVPQINSYIYAQVEAINSCAFLAPFCFGEEPQTMYSLSVSGYGSYVKNGSTVNYNISHTGYSIAVNKYIIYDNVRVYDVTGNFSFNGVFSTLGLNGSGACNIIY